MNARGLLFGLILAAAIASTTLLVGEMAIWGWSPNVQVPDYMIGAALIWGAAWGIVGAWFGMARL